MKRVAVPYELLLQLVEQAEEAVAQLQIHVGGQLPVDLAESVDAVRHFLPAKSVAPRVPR